VVFSAEAVFAIYLIAINPLACDQFFIVVLLGYFIVFYLPTVTQFQYQDYNSMCTHAGFTQYKHKSAAL